jgi:hypothetical protein
MAGHLFVGMRTCSCSTAWVSVKPGPSSSTRRRSALPSLPQAHAHRARGPLHCVVHQVAQQLERIALVHAPGQVGRAIHVKHALCPHIPWPANRAHALHHRGQRQPAAQSARRRWPWRGPAGAARCGPCGLTCCATVAGSCAAPVGPAHCAARPAAFSGCGPESSAPLCSASGALALAG